MRFALILCSFFSAMSRARCSFAFRLIEPMLEIEALILNNSPPLLLREALRSDKTVRSPLLLCEMLLNFIRIEYQDVLISRD